MTFINYQSNIKPAFETNNVAITTACSDDYIPYLSVFLQSLIMNTKQNNNYDILILENNVTQENKEIINNTYASENISIRFVHVLDEEITEEILQVLQLQNQKEEQFFKLLAPNILKNYSKICYLDIDVIIKEDIKNLYDIDIEDKTIGACPDLVLSGRITLSKKIKKHLIENLKLKNYENFVQCGVLLINCDKFRKNSCAEKLINLTKNTILESIVNDLYNKLFENDIFFLDTNWNHQEELKLFNMKKIIDNMPDDKRNMYLQNKETHKILHYAGKEKPWTPQNVSNNFWWDIAKKTPYYNDIIFRLIVSQSNLICALNNELKLQNITSINNRVSLNHYNSRLLFVMRHYIYYTIKKYWYKFKKSFSFDASYEKYEYKYIKAKNLLKDSKRLKKQYKKI